MFREGGSLLLPESAFKRFVEGRQLLGRADGQFVTTRPAMDRLIAQTGGDLAALRARLGTSWNERLYRIDVHNPLLHNTRMPSGMEQGANEFFRWGGYTSGGMPEAAIDPIPVGGFTVTPLF
jgi:hypothetical protein